jgi:uncharacterized membrane protein YphA (DoxX/SURF4 family)
MTVLSLYMLAFCRVVVGVVFALSSASKVRNIAQFRKTINTFAILPSKLSGPVAILFLSGELAVAILMIAGGLLLMVGFSLAICLLLLFCTALISVLARGIHTSCNCFGASEKQVSSADVWRNGGFILCAAGGCVALLWAQGASSPLGLVEWIVIGLGGVIFVLIWLELGEIFQLLHRG